MTLEGAVGPRQASSGSYNGPPVSVYAITIFLSAFLLFLVQPVIAKMILPWFGGSSGVWSTCMLFFQALLLAGYGYAHEISERLGTRTRAIVHISLLAGSLAVLPVIPGATWKPVGGENPSWRILALLTATVGLPYFLLSATSPLVQVWYSRARGGASPYRLFAVSNLASMLALVSYPPLIEPYLPVRMQGQLWSAAYACFVVLCAVAAWRGRGHGSAALGQTAPAADGPPPSAALRLLWVGLAACASTLLLAMTAFLTQDIAPIPFLWLLPLAAYLLSFIICFDRPALYRRRVFLPLFVLALGILSYQSWQLEKRIWLMHAIPACTAALFVCCMVCHGEIVRLRPAPRYLTAFYAMISLGGAAGGVFVGLAAPYLFRTDYEFQIGLALCALLVAAALFRSVPALGRQWPATGMAAALAGYLVFIGVVMREKTAEHLVDARNFYGRLSVRDGDEDDGFGVRRKLLHGIIDHGYQFVDSPLRPVSYFCPASGIGRAMEALESRGPRRIGILGLGCGTLLAYGRPGDYFRVYEINPLVLEIARTRFTFLSGTPARVDVALGDGRLVLEREPAGRFDLLVMDAFSGDSVPAHLVTREAFQTYFRHLAPDGILAVNVSNRYLDLHPVMARAAQSFGKIALGFAFTPTEDDAVCYKCDWVLIADPAVAGRMAPLKGGQKIVPDLSFRLWTDDYSSVHQILKLRSAAM